ncbi:MAG: antitoxin HigA [Thermodesulfobacteriota bacterium]|nr:antitoxin HigA [Thermodesulfobacteriota bacterium]
MKRDTALRLAKFFGTDAQSWMKLQTLYDLAIPQETLAERLEKEVVTYQGLTSSGLSERM